MPKRPRISISLDKDLLNTLQEYTQVRGYRSISVLISVAATSFVRRNPVKEGEAAPKEKPIVYYGNMDKPGWIYFAKVEMNDEIYCKIGRAVNKSRYSSLKTGLPVEFKIIKEVHVGNYILAERAFHDFYARQRVKNEWYKLTEEDCQDIVKRGVNLIKPRITQGQA